MAPRRPSPWSVYAGFVLWTVLLVFVVLTLWTGHPPVPLPAIPWAQILSLP